MAKKDKFQQLKQGGGTLSSFQDMVEQTNTVAAIVKQEEERRGEQNPVQQAARETSRPSTPTTQQAAASSDAPRMTHLPNPWISAREYNLASQYCYQHDNMTRQDFMELAIIEKLHNDGLMPDEEFNSRQSEIRSRPPRGQRKNTKNQMNK